MVVLFLTKVKYFLTIVLLLSLFGVEPAIAKTYSKPQPHQNICQLFKKNSGWYRAAKQAEKRWGTPIYVQMAILHQESGFKQSVRPARHKILGLVPLPRTSSAYGYCQAKNETWKTYKRATGRIGGSRAKFNDAADFVAWYGYYANQKLGIHKGDAFKLYLAYHEGLGGYKKQTYRSKKWLLSIAKSVQAKAQVYKSQLYMCS